MGRKKKKTQSTYGNIWNLRVSVIKNCSAAAGDGENQPIISSVAFDLSCPIEGFQSREMVRTMSFCVENWSKDSP